MKRLILIALAAILVAVIVAGCGEDDECPTCPTSSQLGTMLGQVVIDEGQIEMYGQVVGLDNKMLPLDSVTFDGYQVEVDAIGEGWLAYWIGTSQPDELTGYQSGDTADIRIYTPYGACTCAPVLLDEDQDIPAVEQWGLNYPNYDTVDVQTEITVTWHPVENADWYLFLTGYEYDSLGLTEAESEYFMGTTDTTITRPGSAIPYDGRLYVAVAAVTGPTLDATTGNIQCSIIGGSIHSLTHESFTIYVGTGESNPGSRAGRDPSEELILEDMLRKLGL